MTTDLPDEQWEQWLPVPGYEGYYSVSNLGRVRSDKRTMMDKNGHARKIPEVILTPEKRSSGHLVVCLWKNHERTKRYVHHIVLETFTGGDPAGMQACHWNDDPGDNRLENLRWGTSPENTIQIKIKISICRNEQERQERQNMRKRPT